MNKINVLGKHVAQLIAAGEVVERPAAALKELLENAIDAGATRITAEIKCGGIKLIKVLDNGSGIYRGDVKNAFLRHATSKLKTAQDLASVHSLGFRGEALASVCAVSKTELITKSREESFGTRFLISEGVPEELCDTGCADGTLINVRDLFFNVPARMKFLKKDVIEAGACAAVVDKLALSHPDISFKFIRDGKETLCTPGDGKISSAIYSVYGKEFFEGMIPLNYSLSGFEISGYVSVASASKSSRSMQNFFVNGRYVKSRVASGALEEAFKNSIMAGKFPYCAMYIKTPAEFVDVNVHPAKTEVKFTNEKLLFEAVYYAVKSALLRENDSAPRSALTNTMARDSAPVLITSRNNKQYELHTESEKKESLIKEKNRESHSLPHVNNWGSAKKDDIFVQKEEQYYNFGNIIREKAKEKIFENKIISFYEPTTMSGYDSKQKSDFSKLNVIGEIFKCYIIMEYQNDMILVDKHAAHERILFEKLKENKRENAFQQLLEPVIATLEKNEHSALVQNTDILSEVGFELEDFGGKSVIIRSIPMYLDVCETTDAVTEIANHLINNKKSINTAGLDWLYHNIACRAAIKAGSKNTSEEITALVDKLINNLQITHCPHGRPIYVHIGKKFIEKQFGRI